MYEGMRAVLDIGGGKVSTRFGGSVAIAEAFMRSLLNFRDIRQTARVITMSTSVGEELIQRSQYSIMVRTFTPIEGILWYAAQAIHLVTHAYYDFTASTNRTVTSTVHLLISFCSSPCRVIYRPSKILIKALYQDFKLTAHTKGPRARIFVHMSA